MSDRKWGCMSYDIPYKNRTTYSKIARKIRSQCIPVTMSYYLINWALKDYVDEILREEAKNDPGLKWSIHKFDDSEKDKLDALAKRCLNDMIAKQKALLMKKIKEFEEDEIDYDKMRGALRRSENHLENAKSLSTIFMFNNDFSYALAAFSEIIEEQKDRLVSIKQQLINDYKKRINQRSNNEEKEEDKT